MMIDIEICNHCKRHTDELKEVLFNEGEKIVRLGPACEDCIQIILFHATQKYVALLY